MRTKKRIIVSSVLYAVIAIIVVTLLVGSIFAFSYSTALTVWFNHSTSRVETVDTEGQDTEYFKSEYDGQKDLRKAQDEFGQQIQAEGSVLLKNDDKVLPLKKNAKVTLLGVRSYKFLCSGEGAGAIDTKGIPTLKVAFEQAGYTVNETVWNMYSAGAASTHANGASSRSVSEAPVSVFGEAEINSFASSDAAIVVIGRIGIEGSDLSSTSNGNRNDIGDDGKNRHMLELSAEEIATIKLAIEKFGKDKVVVLLNTMNAMELGPIDDLGVKACLWVGAGGQKGLLAVPKILNGDMYPSGRLVDTYAYDALSAPSMQNYGSTAFSGDDNVGNGRDVYVNYLEGIYVGYKYYETRYEDAVLGRAGVGDFKYAETVQYPFGYGLSYTEFTYSDYALKENDKSFDISVKVTNSGDAAGKEVVQIYMQSPYTEYDKTNGLEKAAVQLVGFGKTGELAKNASQTVTVNVPKEYMRTYDHVGHKTYIVEEGEYLFATGKNAHDALNNILAKKGKDVGGNADFVKPYTQKTTDTTTCSTGADGEKITNQLANADMKYYHDDVTYLTRNNWTGTYPTTAVYSRTQKMADDSDITTYYQDDAKAVMPKTNTVSDEYGAFTLVSLMEAEYDEDEYWDALLAQMTAQEMYDLVRMGGYSTILVESIAKPDTVDKDGPAGISSTLIGGVGCFGYPIAIVVASTFNVDISERMGELVGEDGLYSNTHGWYSPGMNIHRSPFSGRNFEYFSEDSCQSGILAAAMVKGVQSKGVYAYIKHFAFNDQENGRSGIYTFLDEQTAREIYLLPFELSIRDGDALGLMDSMNRVGAKWSGAHKELMTNILRKEWGFKGIAITDQASMGGTYLNVKAAIWAGTDLMLNTNANNWTIDGYAENATVMSLLKTASKHILYTVSRSHAMNGFNASTRVVRVMPLWQIWLITLDIVVGVLALAAVGFITYKLIKPKQ